tara:strand:- start:646 stop:939 length:294 start_codon:yes stop_codon:yes gene_type:complete
MKNLILILITSLIIISCGDSQKDQFISACFENSPGGDSYREFCECGWEEFLGMLTDEEYEAMRRDYSEIGDEMAEMRAPFQGAEAGQICMKRMLNNK